MRLGKSEKKHPWHSIGRLVGDVGRLVVEGVVVSTAVSVPLLVWFVWGVDSLAALRGRERSVTSCLVLPVTFPSPPPLEKRLEALSRRVGNFFVIRNIIAVVKQTKQISTSRRFRLFIVERCSEAQHLRPGVTESERERESEGGSGRCWGGEEGSRETMIVALLTTSKNMSTDKPRKEGMKGKGGGQERGRRLKETQSVIRGLGRRGGGVSINHNQFDWHRRLEHVVVRLWVKVSVGEGGDLPPWPTLPPQSSGPATRSSPAVCAVPRHSASSSSQRHPFPFCARTETFV